jgi:hypothetical protein
MTNLWDYLTQPSRANKPIDYSNYADEVLYNATAVPRFIANTGKSVYDSFKRGMVTPNIEDAFNVAGAAMVGGIPGVPKGNAPGTLSMAFRRPQDVVVPTDYSNIVANPEGATLGKIYGKYFNTKWTTSQDPIIKYVDNGGTLPDLPHLRDVVNLRDSVGNATPQQFKDMSEMYSEMTGKSPVITAQTTKGALLELLQDARANANLLDSREATRSLKDFPRQAGYYKENPEVRVLRPPTISEVFLNRQVEKLPGNLNRMSLTDLLTHASEYDTNFLNEQARLVGALEKFHEFDDGHYWTQLKTQAQREAESDAMGNSTRLAMHDDKDLYSLRDKNGKSILTASFIPEWNTFDEIKTRFNTRDVLSEITKNNNPSEHEFYDYVMALKNKAKR